MERCGTNELQFNWVETKPKRKPRKDHCGRILTRNENSQIRDQRFPKSDKRHVVAQLHRHVNDAGDPGESREYDPHTLATPDGVKYLPILEPGQTCDLCENGDMISPWKRHFFTRYRPGERLWHKAWKWMRLKYGWIRCLPERLLRRLNLQ